MRPIIYAEAWRVLHNCFGERCQDEALELMDSVLESVKSDYEERKEQWLTEQDDNIAI